MKRVIYLIMGVLAMLMLSACFSQKAPVTKAIAVIQATNGYTTNGVITFTAVKNGVHVKGEIQHLSSGLHGFHVHQFGDISGEAGKKAGGHYNPKNVHHSNRTAEKRHSGDLGNINANEKGIAVIDFIDSKMTLNGPESILGRALIIHAKKDDLTSQPSGAAGPRIGQAVIGIAK